MCGEEYEQEQGYQVHIVTHLHDVVATGQQKFVHQGREEPEETVGMDESCQFEGVELEILILITYQSWEN